jgi:8-oxo-dGTP diphosphatase
MRTNIRVCAIIKKDQKILLIHRFKNGDEYWVFPGGGVESGETNDEALVREVMEEASLPVISFKQVTEIKLVGDKVHILYTVVTGDGIPTLSGPELADQNENNQYILEWVDIEKISHLPSVYPSEAVEIAVSLV